MTEIPATLEVAKTADEAISKGRACLDRAAEEIPAAERLTWSSGAIAWFQIAIGADPDRDDAYGWLAKAMRVLAQLLRESNPEGADYLLRMASAVVWEAKERTPTASLSGLVKQEAKTLLAWVRTTRRLDPAHGEAEMESLRREYLGQALDRTTVPKLFEA